MDISFDEVSYQRNGGGKADLFKENIKTTEVRKTFKVSSKTRFVNDLELPYVIAYLELKIVHPVIKHSFSGRTVPNVQLAGRLKIFQKS